MGVGIIAAVAATLTAAGYTTTWPSSPRSASAGAEYGHEDPRWPRKTLYYASRGLITTTYRRSGSRDLQSRPHFYGATWCTSPISDIGTRRLLESPEGLRRDNTLLNCVPENGSMDFERGQSVVYERGVLLDGNGDEEEAEWELEEELAEHGLYRGSYQRLVALYSFVPLTALIAFTLLAVIPSILYPSDYTSQRSFPYAPYFPFPVPEILLAMAMWSMGHCSRDSLYSLALTICAPFSSLNPALTIVVTTVVHTVISICLRILTNPILLIPQQMVFDTPTWRDPAFTRVWWIALGWAVAESIASVKQGYEGIGLYQDVLVTVQRHESNDPSVSPGTADIHDLANDGAALELGHNVRSPRATAGSSQAGQDDLRGVQTHDLEDAEYGTHSGDGELQPLLPQRVPSGRQKLRVANAIQTQVDHDIEQLIALKNREELEEVYGIPVIEIPVFISCLQRVNSFFLSLGICLLLSSAYIRSTFAVFQPKNDLVKISSFSSTTRYSIADVVRKTNTHMFVTLPIVFLVLFFLAILHTPLVLPRIGVHSAAYVAALVSLGTFFAGLGVWGALS